MVADAELPIGTTTDSIGGFSMKVPVGRHNIQVSYLGYEPVILKEVLVGSSKEVVLNIGMTESPTNLNEVVVTPHINKAEPLNNMAVTGGRMLSTEEASRCLPCVGNRTYRPVGNKGGKEPRQVGV